MKSILSLSIALHMKDHTPENVALPASETEVPRREVGKSKLAITA
jgi:hypothetical protein